MGSHRPQTKEQEILERAEELLAEAPIESLLSFLSPEKLAEGADFSPAAVRYHFGMDGRRFNPEKLGAALVQRMLEGNRQAAQIAASGYRYASTGVSDFADADKVIEGILADVEQYSGSVLEERPSVAARERMHLLALLISERDEEVAAALRATDEEILSESEAIYQLYLEKTNRKLVDCITARDLAALISSLLFGATLMRRFNPDFEMELVARTVVRVFWAFTYDPSRQKEALYKTDIAEEVNPRRRSGAAAARPKGRSARASSQ
jgi:AcrR family transcriptional regulator